MLLSLWSMMNLQNSNSPTMEFLLFFNDITMILILMLISLFTLMMMLLNIIKVFSLNMSENQSLEDLWLMIPLVLLMFIGFPSIKNLYMCEEYNEMDLNLKIYGHQWYWSYEFMNMEMDSFLNKDYLNFRLLETFNQLIIPIKCMIRILVSSEDVIHSWTIPSLGIKMDAIPGRVSQSILMVNRPGIMSGQCSEICGSNHSFMPILISANSLKNFFI